MRSIVISRTAIGIDIGRRCMKAAQLSISGRRHQITALAMLPRTRDPASREPKIGEQINRQELLNLSSVLRRQGFHGNDVVLASPEQQLLRGVFEAPQQMASDAMAQIARMELSRMHNVPPDSFEVVCWQTPTGKSKSTMQTIAVGCPHDVANVLLDLFEDSSFNVIALDLQSAAGARACSSLTVQPPAITAILDLGWCSTKLLLVCGGTIIYERFLDTKCIGGLISKMSEVFGITEESADQTISTIGFVTDGEVSELDKKPTEAIRRIIRKHFDMLLEELKAPFEYASHQYLGEGIKRLLLIGGGARILGLSQYCQDRLNVEVISAAPNKLVVNSMQILAKADHPAMTVAVGLAMFAGG